MQPCNRVYYSKIY